MSSYKIISEVSKFLRRTLWEGFAGDVELTGHVPNEEAIVLLNPSDAAEDKQRRLSFWLYQVQENPYMRNQSLARVPQSDELLSFPPLPLNLFYLLTPSTNSMEGDQMVLGRSMQIFHDNPVLLLESAEQPGSAEELHVNLCQRDLREIAEVWEALQQPYRLSVCYEVRVTRIDSLRRLKAGRISERNVDFEEKPAEVGG